MPARSITPTIAISDRRPSRTLIGTTITLSMYAMWFGLPLTILSWCGRGFLPTTICMGRGFVDIGRSLTDIIEISP